MTGQPLFKCTKCENTNLDMVQETGTQHPVEINEERVIIDFNAVPQEHYKQYYQCAICKEKLLNKNGTIVSNHPEFKEWIANRK